MRKKRRWLIEIGIFVGVLGILGFVAYLQAEAWAKSYIEDKYPGVKIGHLDIHWRERRATLFNDRENLKATLDRSRASSPPRGRPCPRMPAASTGPARS